MEQTPAPGPSSRGRDRPLNNDDDVIVADEFVPYVKGHTKMSRRMPAWMWVAIAKALGIKLHHEEKPIVSSILHVLTLFSGVGMVFTRAWYSGYDISSIHSATDMVDGFVSVAMISMYCAIGIYSHRLAYRLFVHPKFLEKVRLHSKTIMKVNAALAIVVVCVAFVVVQNLGLSTFLTGYTETKDIKGNDTEINPCQTIQVPLAICQSFFFLQLIFSFFFALWIIIVAVVLISVARTHTIDIRRLLTALCIDAHLVEKRLRKNLYRTESEDYKEFLKEHVWVDHDHIGTVLQNQSNIPTPPEERRDVPEDVRDADAATATDIEEEDISPQFSQSNVHLELSRTNTENQNRPDEASRTRPKASRLNLRSRLASSVGRFRRLPDDNPDGETINDSDDEDIGCTPHIMSEQEIMHKYWKLSAATRLTSMAFQRWMCCMTITIMVWSTIRVIFWLSHKPTLYGILSFILPLMLLPLLASSYAEVNYEGVKVIQSIMPTPHRVPMFQYLYGMPIQMTVYGHRVSYGTMGTVLAAITAAFASKIFLQEISMVIKV